LRHDAFAFSADSEQLGASFAQYVAILSLCHLKEHRRQYQRVQYQRIVGDNKQWLTITPTQNCTSSEYFQILRSLRICMVSTDGKCRSGLWVLIPANAQHAKQSPERPNNVPCQFTTPRQATS
jgi:hypothetical protein